MAHLRRTIVSGCLAAVVLAVGLACHRDRGVQPRRAILILLDAARADRFGSYGYPRPTTPHMDRLASRGWVVTHHFAQGTHTRDSLPSLLYSRYFANPIFPYDPNVPFASPATLMRRDDDELFSLPRALADEGFTTAAISSHIWLKPDTRFAREFQQLLDLSTLLGYDRKYAYPRGEQVVDSAIDWLKKNGRGDFFLYLHLMDTHFPHFLEADAESFLQGAAFDASLFHHDGSPKDPSRPLPAAGRAYLDALYDGSLRYADRQVGRLARFLEGRGMLDDTLIVITSDHGEHLLESAGRFGHGGPWYDRVARVPLILFYPAELPAGRLTSLTEAVDVSPTMLRLLNVPIPRHGKPDGDDLIAIASGAQPAKEHVLQAQAIRSQRHKCIFQNPVAELLSEPAPAIEGLAGELYDLSTDPEERNNLWASEPLTVARLLEAFRGQMQWRFRRYQAAVNHDPPAGPFAISSRHFDAGAEVPAIALDSPADAVREVESASGWILLGDWQRHLLVARTDAEALEIEFPLPDGEYRVIALVSGRCAVEIGDDGHRVELRGPAFDLADRVTATTAEIGPVLVTGEVFRARLHPSTTESWFAIQFFGFVPAGSEHAGVDEERLERLRTLGYLD